MASGEASRDPSSTRAPRGSYASGPSRSPYARIYLGAEPYARALMRGPLALALYLLSGGGLRPAVFSHLCRVGLRPSALLPTTRALSLDALSLDALYYVGP